ncbi:MAG: MoaD/ThiS family protein [Actinomycetota bacterium]|nr:MoaD/ThiS family protein [Actinomycetota bacterium]
MDAPALNSIEIQPANDAVAVTLRMFAAARQEAGTGSESVRAATVAQVLDDASCRHGSAWSRVAAISRVWVNGEPADAAQVLCDGDEVAVLPPVSGGMA